MKWNGLLNGNDRNLVRLLAVDFNRLADTLIKDGLGKRCFIGNLAVQRICFGTAYDRINRLFLRILELQLAEYVFVGQSTIGISLFKLETPYGFTYPPLNQSLI